jgi:hypothetical protein
MCSNINVILDSNQTITTFIPISFKCQRLTANAYLSGNKQSSACYQKRTIFFKSSDKQTYKYNKLVIKTTGRVTVYFDSSTLLLSEGILHQVSTHFKRF